MRILQIIVLVLAGLLGANTVMAAPSADVEAMKKEKAPGGADKKALDGAPKALDYIAIVNGERVSMGQYVSTLRRGLRDRFYHGKIPEEEGKKFRKEIADQLIDKALLVQEAKRRQLTPDVGAVDASVKAFDAKYQDNPEWKKARETVLPQVREKLNDDSLLKVLEERVRKVAAPTADELKRYYDENKDLFTTPVRVSVSLILLRVDPAATSEVWKQASEEGASIVERLNSGADFAELARIHSSDTSAKDGGAMGFVHAGMLGEGAQNIIDLMEPGEISAPVVTLEGVSIFRLDERVEPSLNSFESVKGRAEGLYVRDAGEKAWKDLLSRLHAAATIVVNDIPWRK